MNARKKKNLKLVLMVGGPILVIAIGAWYWLYASRYVTTENAYVHANKYLISPQVSGQVVDVRVDENQPVKQGELLFQIDPQPYQIAVDQAEANLAAARDQIESQKAAWKEAKAKLGGAKDDLAYLTRELKRKHALEKGDVVPSAKVDELENKYQNAKAQVSAIEAQIGRIEASLGGNPELPAKEQASWRQAKAALDKAKLDLSHTRITSPTDGVVSSNDLEQGEFVAAGQPQFAVMAIHEHWIEANLKETQLTDVKVGQPVEIDVDAYPNTTWHGHVKSISAGTGAVFSVLPPQNATGNWVKVVQRVPVRIAVEEPSDAPPLRAGLSTQIKIDLRGNHGS